MTDLEIANQVEAKPIAEIAKQLNISEDQLEPFGRTKAKLPLQAVKGNKLGKLVLVSAMTPTPAGEGKTTVSIGLTDGMNKVGKQATAVLREPSLGPVFGMKGGATGGGHSQVIPMEDINLHFTGDLAAVEKAHNLLAALVDNHLHHHSKLGLDPRTVVWKRVMDMNDRALRKVNVGMGGKGFGIPRETGFDITAASEVMAILCLSADRSDLKRRLGDIFIGYTFDKKPVYASDLNAQGAMAILLKDAIKPNLVQTLEGNPVILHGGPFANIAQGTNTLIATKMGLNCSEHVITEAGFGFDLGGEKFLDIKCRAGGLAPDCVVLVATLRALKFHGGVALADLQKDDQEALQKGFQNLAKHLENVQKFGLPVVVALNVFSGDKEEELAFIQSLLDDMEVASARSTAWADGGSGATDLAEAVLETIEKRENEFQLLYSEKDSLEAKIETLAREIYGADGVDYTAQALKDIRRIKDLGQASLPVCMAKTQYSFSDDAKALGRPQNFRITVREIEMASGAGFLVPICGTIMRMPGLPKTPAAEKIDIDRDGKISGLF